MVHFLMLTTLAVSSAVAAPQAIQWQADYGKALAATRGDDRPLLVVLDKPSDPAAETGQLEGSQAKLLAAYQLCHIDATTEYGQQVAQVFKADKFPFTAIIDKTGSVVLHKQQGPLTDAQWSKTLSTYQAGERVRLEHHTSAYRGLDLQGAGVVNPSYCPSCQKNN
jgi:hypothetical protein